MGHYDARAATVRGGSRYIPVFGRDDRSMNVQPVVINTADDRSWDGMLYRPLGPSGGRRRLGVVLVHGSVGNYISGLPRALSFGIARAGYTVLATNTRMANYGVFFGGGLLNRTPLDLDAALGLLRRLDFQQVVLVGFSMGATIVTHYQALRRPAEVVGVGTVAHPASLPRSTRRRWERFDSEPSYEETTALVRERLRPDPEDPSRDRIFVARRAAGPTDLPRDAEIWTYRTWWFSRGPEAYHAISRLRIGQVTVPVALIQGDEDEIVPVTEGPELAKIAELGTCPDVTLETVPGADHVFSGCEAPLTEALVAWLDQLLATLEPAEPAALVGHGSL